MKQNSQSTDQLLRVGKRLIISGFLTQSIILGLVTFSLIIASHLSSSEKSKDLIQREFQRLRLAMVQSVFVLETHQSEKPILGSEIPQVAALNDNLKLNGIDANIEINFCAAIPARSKGTTVFFLDIGTRVLKNCVFVTQKNPLITPTLVVLMVALCLSMIAMIVMWAIFKNVIADKFLHPVLRRLEEKSVQIQAGEIARQVAHDIRSPLTALRVAADSVLEKPDGAVELIHMAVARIERIADDLLKKEHQTGLNGGRVFTENLDEVLQEIIREKKIEYSGISNLTIEAIANENRRAQFFSNQVDLRRVVSNLLNNSIEASIGANKITISTSVIDQFAEISIVDEGIGIPEDIREAINNDSAQTDGPLHTTKTEGNGLGLRSAKQAIVRAGGWLFVDRNFGVGTKVSFRIPVLNSH